MAEVNNVSRFSFPTSTPKRRELKENQYITRDYNSSTPLYSLEKIHEYDWRIFMWLASLEKIENFIYLFIVIWNATPLKYNKQEFSNETNNMIQLIKDLSHFGALNANRPEIYCKTLEDYRQYCINGETDLKENLVYNAWIELEGCGLRQVSYAFEDQLNRLSSEQKVNLRNIIFTRMNSFYSITKTSNEKRPKDGEIKFLIKENESLKNQVETLVKENSQQQAALGNLTNLSWNEEDSNSTTKLISHIEELQDMLSDFTMVQGSDYKINDEAAVVTLRVNKCQAKYPSTKAKLVLGTLLQCHAIKTILEDVQKYIKNTRPHADDIEGEIVKTTEHLIKYTKLLRDNRGGNDDITKIAPIKIRQQAYSALSCRGLSDEHPLIKDIANKLLNEMNEYRQVLDKETNDELHKQAIQITCKVVNIFCFRLKTQAFEPTHQFFQAGQDVDARLMQGAFGRDEAKKLEVEACGFPCIGIFNGDKSNQKVFTKAQIITRPKGDKRKN